MHNSNHINHNLKIKKLISTQRIFLTTAISPKDSQSTNSNSNNILIPLLLQLRTSRKSMWIGNYEKNQSSTLSSDDQGQHQNKKVARRSSIQEGKTARFTSTSWNKFSFAHITSFNRQISISFWIAQLTNLGSHLSKASSLKLAMTIRTSFDLKKSTSSSESDWENRTIKG